MSERFFINRKLYYIEDYAPQGKGKRTLYLSGYLTDADIRDFKNFIESKEVIPLRVKQVL
jgi:hypothetical protein